MSRRRDIELGIEALRLCIRGHDGAAVAAELHIAVASVRSRMKRLYRALGARDMVHAVVIAAIDGLLTREDLRAAYQDRRDAGEAITNGGNAE